VEARRHLDALQGLSLLNLSLILIRTGILASAQETLLIPSAESAMSLKHRSALFSKAPLPHQGPFS
jgi:hypothetical protein